MPGMFETEGKGRVFVCGGGGGGDRALRPDPPPKGSIDRTPHNPTETDPPPLASEVTQAQKSAKNENGIFGNQHVEGVQKSHHLPDIW